MNREFSEWPCSLARAVGVFGELLDAASSSATDCRTHPLRRVPAIPQYRPEHTVRPARKLVDAGVMTKRFYQDNPPRYEYLLTDMGRDFFPVLAAMLAWGDRWLDDGGGAPVALRHDEATARAITRSSLRSSARTAASPSCTPASSSASVPGTRRRPAELDMRGRLAPSPRLPSASAAPGTARRNAPAKPPAPRLTLAAQWTSAGFN